MTNKRNIAPQSITSEGTSVNQVPGLFSSADFEDGARNLDYGGGRHEKGTEYLKTRGVENHVYDPFNRSKEHNQAVLDRFKKNPADTATVANVLNVIPEREHRLAAIHHAAQHVKPGGRLFFSVYEKNKTGVGEKTRAGYQANRPLADYLDEIRSVLPDAERKGNMIVATTKKVIRPKFAAGGSVDDAAVNRALLASARAIKRARGGRAFADMLRSGGAEAARALKQERGTPQQMLAALKGVKKEELEHSRVADLIKDQPLVTKDEIANIFDRNTPDVEEKKKKDPYEEKWTLPGGFNSRVLLLKLPEYEGFEDEKQHWKDDPNTAAHIRLKDRVGPNGEKILHVEEVQSDWGQVGRQRGFGKSSLTLRPGEIEPAPYVTNTESWTDLALKRVMHEAAKGGYDKVMWTPAEIQSKRYNLTNYIDTLAYLPYQDSSGKTLYKLRAGKDGRMLTEQSGLDEQGLASHVGKEMAQKIIDGHKTETRDINTVVGGDDRPIGQRKAMIPWNVISGLDLEVGGQWPKKYYGLIVPNSFKRILKDHGGVEFGSTENVTPQRVYDEAVAPHWRAYDEALATNRRAYDEAIATHRRAYQEALTTHERAYDEAVATQRRARDEAIATNQRALDEARARGEDVDDPGFPKLPSFDVTPEMRESILNNGFKTFARGGEVEKSAMNDDSINRALLVAARAAKAVGGVPQKTINGELPPEVLQNLASQFENVRGTKIGRTVARYQTPPAQQAVQTMYNDLYKMAREGTPGRYWYEKSSKDILRHVGGDKNLADKFAQLIAIYSPQTTVPINTGNAIKAYNRAMAGEPIWKGEIINPDISFNTIAEANKYIRSLGGKGANITKVPLDDSGKRFLIARHDIASYENIATADRDLRAHLLMNHDIPFEGRKINNFYNNLMVHIDPSRLQGSTQDLWMAHAFGFPDTAVGAAGKYTFMEQLTQHLADELGWRPHQVQAAIWTAVKTRMEATSDAAKKLAVERGLARMVPGNKGKLKFQPNEGAEDQITELHRDLALGQKISRSKILRSSKDFSDFLRENLAHVSWESTPSTKIDHLGGIHDLPYEAKAEYHGLISKALQDEKGNDLLAKYLGMLSPGSVDAPGYWEGSVNPASQLLVGSTRIKAAGQRADLDEPSKELMEVYAAAKGLLHKQDGVGYHRPFFNPQVTKANGIQFTFDKDLDHDHIINVGKNLDPNFALIPVNNRTLRMLNLDKNAADQKKFHDAVTKVVQQHVPNEFNYQSAHFGSDNDLVGNDWEKDANGEGYSHRLRASKRPDVLGYVANVLAPRVEAVDREFAEKYGLKTNPRIEASIRNASQEGQPQEQVSQPLNDASTQRALALTAPQRLAAARVMAAPQPGRRYKP